MTYAELTLRLVTPLFTGSADPNSVDYDWPLRPSEVKGVWRWWARTFVSGALYEAGQLHGHPDKDIIKVPKKDEAKKVSKIVGEKLGLGYAGEESVASHLKLIIRHGQNIRINKACSNRVSGKVLQRIGLLTLDCRTLQYVEPSAEFYVTIDKHNNVKLNDDNAIKASLSVLSIALTLSCFGKGGRRGLGCLDVDKVDGDYSFLFNLNHKEFAKKLNYTIELVKDIVKEMSKSGLESCELPPMPVVSNVELTKCVDVKVKNRYVDRLFVFQLFEVYGRDLLPKLHNFFLRPERAKILMGNPKAKDELRNEFMAWILGLPREQKGTGYRLMSNNIVRRASSMLLSIHGINNDVAYLALFLSADWPSGLTWHGAGSKPITINERDIINASYVALNEFLEYLGRQRIRWKRVWPQ
ncbi:type III-B CRISPR module RAMP protein Cmr1 [Caldivirga maquilingensis]|uniref:CRISPR-associated RAMP protein, Cmr1 family n=1 Tax=Caldivirga maquilingensis (strain ATCC 700844 / DSM 13496 / JCM 10307 / IC-167) TaxID=397948 RepID=A8M9C0_CALMQ|nr:type III-B CRISPR module RAMP protein Cmr1 [Caldivirga maquilingensis]ABW02339.1 CRISPR-associated RAMP protein, Cmr1 family [Caldivirga maquilingensis IC-167]